MSIAFATRRLWARRSRRTWYAITWVFGALIKFFPPMWVFWFYRGYFRSFKNTGSDAFILGTIANVIIAIAIPTTIWQRYLSRDATVQELRAARAADSCFDDTIVRRAAAWNRPVTVRDIVQTQDDCAEMWADIDRKNAQAAALKSQLEK